MTGTWLLTGGAGYIGSHVARAMTRAALRVVVLDNLSTGRPDRLDPGIPLIIASAGDVEAVRHVIRHHGIDGVIHLAAEKSVEESVRDPKRYYRENLGGMMSLLEAMHAEGVKNLVFSSSAAVYGTPSGQRVTETSPTAPESAYGRTKLVGEWMIRDAALAHGISAISLRYFNVVGAEEPHLADLQGANLFPQVIARIGAGEPVTVFGSDYPTSDGTCVRDYIHVVDLAEAHVTAARLISDRPCVEVVNVGCGRGYSVLEVVDAFAGCVGAPVPYVMTSRRPGDAAEVVADTRKATELLNWRARLDLTHMVRSAWSAAMHAHVLTRPAPIGR